MSSEITASRDGETGTERDDGVGNDPGATARETARDRPDAGGSERGRPGETGFTEATIERTVDRETERWRGIAAVAFFAGAFGVIFSRPPLLLASGLGIAYSAYALVGTPPDLSLSVRRRLDATHPEPGDDVTVELSVRNDGGFLADLRLVDQVPEELVVTEGSPRLATALRSGETATVEYTVRATRGDHAFERLQVIARDLSGSDEREAWLSTDTTLRCLPELSAPATVPLRKLTSRYTGRVSTDVGGEGIEFYSTREYRPGDSLSRIDWNRHARTGELSTVEFREERAATVVLLVDTREGAYCRPDEDSRHAVDRSVTAAAQVFASLLDSGDRVGLASFGPHDAWLSPGTGSDHRARAQRIFGSDQAFAPTVPQGSFFLGIRRKILRKRLPPDAQLLVFTPLVDDGIAATVRLLDAYGHLVTVVSPDPTTDDTPGHGLGRAERAARITGLRESGIRVIDMPRGTNLATALARGRERWSR